MEDANRVEEGDFRSQMSQFQHFRSQMSQFQQEIAETMAARQEAIDKIFDRIIRKLENKVKNRSRFSGDDPTVVEQVSQEESIQEMELKEEDDLGEVTRAETIPRVNVILGTQKQVTQEIYVIPDTNSSMEKVKQESLGVVEQDSQDELIRDNQVIEETESIEEKEEQFIEAKSVEDEEHLDTIKTIKDDDSTSVGLVVPSNVSESLQENGMEDDMKAIEQTFYLDADTVNCKVIMSQLEPSLICYGKHCNSPLMVLFDFQRNHLQGSCVKNMEEIATDETDVNKHEIANTVFEVMLQRSEIYRKKTMKLFIKNRKFKFKGRISKERELCLGYQSGVSTNRDSEDVVHKLDGWLFDFVQLFRIHVGLDYDAHVDLHELVIKLCSKVLEETITSEEAQIIFNKVTVNSQEVAVLTSFNWSNEKVLLVYQFDSYLEVYEWFGFQAEKQRGVVKEEHVVVIERQVNVEDKISSVKDEDIKTCSSHDVITKPERVTGYEGEIMEINKVKEERRKEDWFQNSFRLVNLEVKVVLRKGDVIWEIKDASEKSKKQYYEKKKKNWHFKYRDEALEEMELYVEQEYSEEKFISKGMLAEAHVMVKGQSDGELTIVGRDGVDVSGVADCKMESGDDNSGRDDLARQRLNRLKSREENMEVLGFVLHEKGVDFVVAEYVEDAVDYDMVNILGKQLKLSKETKVYKELQDCNDPTQVMSLLLPKSWKFKFKNGGSKEKVHKGRRNIGFTCELQIKFMLLFCYGSLPRPPDHCGI